MWLRVAGFMRRPEVAGEAAVASLVNVAVVLGAGLAWGRALIPMLLLAAGVGAATRLSDLYLVRFWRASRPAVRSADDDERLVA
jgi:hypothetical protein